PAFGQGISTSFAPGTGPVAAPPLARAPETPDAPRRRPGAAARVRLAAGQLLINQRVSQAAVRRANGVERRLAGGLTGGDLRPGAIDASRLAPGLSVDVAVPVATTPGPSRTVVAPATRRRGARVTLSAAQL